MVNFENFFSFLFLMRVFFFAEDFIITASNVREYSESEKLVFIQYVLSLPESEIFAELKTDFNLDEKQIWKIYYENNIRRSWIYCEDKRFYCIYCLCFGIDSKESCSCSFVNGQNFQCGYTEYIY